MRFVLKLCTMGLIEYALLILVQVRWQGTHVLPLVQALVLRVLRLFYLLTAQGVVVNGSLSNL